MVGSGIPIGLFGLGHIGSGRGALAAGEPVPGDPAGAGGDGLTRRRFVGAAVCAGLVAAMGGPSSLAIAQGVATGAADSQTDADLPWKQAYLDVCEDVVSRYGEPSWEPTADDGYYLADGLALATLVPMGGAASVQLVLAYRPEGTPAEQVTDIASQGVIGEYLVEVWDFDAASGKAVKAWSGNVAGHTNGGWIKLTLAYGTDGTVSILAGIDGDELVYDVSYLTFVGGTFGVSHSVYYHYDTDAGVKTYSIDGVQTDVDTYEAQRCALECFPREICLYGRGGIGDQSSIEYAYVESAYTLALLRSERAAATGDAYQRIRDAWGAASQSGWQAVPDISNLACPAISRMSLVASGSAESLPQESAWENTAGWVAWGADVEMGTDKGAGLVVGVGPQGGTPLVVGLYCTADGMVRDLTRGLAVACYSYDQWGVVADGLGAQDAGAQVFPFHYDTHQSCAVCFDLVGGRVVPTRYAQEGAGTGNLDDVRFRKNGVIDDTGETALVLMTVQIAPELAWEQLAGPEGSASSAAESAAAAGAQGAAATGATYTWSDAGGYPVIASSIEGDAAVQAINDAIEQHWEEGNTDTTWSDQMSETSQESIGVTLFQNGFVSVLSNRAAKVQGGIHGNVGWDALSFDVRTGERVEPWATFGVSEDDFAAAAEQAIVQFQVNNAIDTSIGWSVQGRVPDMLDSGDLLCVPSAAGLSVLCQEYSIASYAQTAAGVVLLAIDASGMPTVADSSKDPRDLVETAFMSSLAVPTSMSA
jgi:hypothetical protein